MTEDVAGAATTAAGLSSYCFAAAAALAVAADAAMAAVAAGAATTAAGLSSYCSAAAAALAAADADAALQNANLAKSNG